MGTVVYERAYYHCPHCRHGAHPTDAELGVARRQTPAAQEVLALIGVLGPFEEGARQVLPRLSGLNVSAATVQRTTEDVGRDVAEKRAAGQTFGPALVWGWNRDAEGRKVGYVALDATAVPQQGPHAERAEGRMPWVAAVFNPQPTHEPVRRRRVWDARYVSGLLSLPEIGRQLRQECRAVGLGQVDVIVALSDGGNGLENCLREAVAGLGVSDLEFVLDFYHVSEHLLEFAKVLLPDDEPAREQQLNAWRDTLQHKGGETLYRELKSLDLSTATTAMRQAHEGLLGYLRTNLHRMDYPQYVARGWQIGSGLIESACKTVVCRRLKVGGMRWREPGTTALCQLRSLYRSESAVWTNYWARNAAG
jgi:hypothetical protein